MAHVLKQLRLSVPICIRCRFIVNMRFDSFRGLLLPPLFACRSDSRFGVLSPFASVEARRLVFFWGNGGSASHPSVGVLSLTPKISRRTSRGVSRFRPRLNIYIRDFAAIFICSQYLG